MSDAPNVCQSTCSGVPHRHFEKSVDQPVGSTVKINQSDQIVFQKRREMLPLFLLWSLCVSAHPTLHWASRVVSQTYEDARLIAEEPSVRYPSSFFEETSHPDQKVISAAPNAPVWEVIKFKDQTRLENLAARSNGQLVLTSISDTKLRLLDPSKKNSKAQTVYTFPEATSLSGVVETSPDVFAVVAGNWSIKTFEGVKGSFSLWLVDFNKDTPSVKQIAKIPEAASLNGIAVHPCNKYPIILISHL